MFKFSLYSLTLNHEDVPTPIRAAGTPQIQRKVNDLMQELSPFHHGSNSPDEDIECSWTKVINKNKNK
jgi:hypothetical protein